MEYDDYLREQAGQYREQAEKSKDPRLKEELVELAAVCEQIANRMEDRLTAG